MYRCISPFRSQKSKNYIQGQEISSSEYYDLHYDERHYFEDISSVSLSADSSSNMFPDTNGNFIPDAFESNMFPDTNGNFIPDAFESNSGSSFDSSPDTSSNDFGGGDFGGGGAGGEW